MLFAVLLKSIVKFGTLKVVDANGRTHTFKGSEGPSVTIRLHDRALHSWLFFNPMLAVGEAFMDGTLTIEEGSDIYDFLSFCSRNMGSTYGHLAQEAFASLRRMTKRITQHNPIGKAQKNVAHHYDLSETLYELFLDRDRQYSCAYFTSPQDDLDEAQANKKLHIAAKLLLEPDRRVLDIGSGWGGLALYLAEISGVDVTGVTLSTEQQRVAQKRAEGSGMDDRVRFLLTDYRDLNGKFDRIVSVGMFEHVGVGHYREFFGKIRDLLSEDGVALLHSIGRFDGPGSTNPWMRKYIFPGGYVPALSEVLPAIETSGLLTTDIEILRLHYAETLKAWRKNFNANRRKITQIYDDRFCRMWDFYLAGSEASFRYGGIMVFQVQITKQMDAVPLTRDYITDWERAQRQQGREAA
ncbi:MAG: cyclopropane-fatty-acyl-phospholipid synthase [Proteobacteria bacterium]|nr:cyclopropane-fatty-acyl-phospholipid synthase [Pseudomonadota bacterium]